jgi:hypothetical protein
MSTVALAVLREQHDALDKALRAERDVLRDATSLDAECRQTLRSLAEDNARMNGLVMIERGRGETQSATHEAKLRELSRQGDTARNAAASRERALRARIAKLDESVGRATALVGEKEAQLAKNARLRANNGRMEHLLGQGSACVPSSYRSRMLLPRGSIWRATTLVGNRPAPPSSPHGRSPSVYPHTHTSNCFPSHTALDVIRMLVSYAAHAAVRDAEAKTRAQQQRVQTEIAAMQATLVAREEQLARSTHVNTLIRDELARVESESAGSTSTALGRQDL